MSVYNAPNFKALLKSIYMYCKKPGEMVVISVADSDLHCIF